MKIKQKKGISLIVLVITIIVMIILASAIILSLNSSGIIGKANKAKEESDRANLLEAANIAAAEWELEERLNNIEEDKLTYIKNKLSEQGFSEKLIAKVQIDSKGNILVNDYMINKVTIENVNLYNKAEMKIGYYYLNGTEGVNAKYNTTGYIEVDPGDELYWTAYLPEYEQFEYQFIDKYYLLQTAVYISTFDSNKQFIETISSHSQTFDKNNNNASKPWTVPENVEYIKLSFKAEFGLSQLADTLVICKNEPPKYYSEYNQTEITINYTIDIPEEIKVASGTSFNIYNKNICPTSFTEELTFKWECNIGTESSDGISFNPTSSDIGNHKAKVLVYDKSNKLVASKTTNIEVVENKIEEQESILLIGDSLSNGKSWITKVETLSNNKIDITASAISGASTGAYYSSATNSGSTNPFYNEEIGTFDYEYYLETNNVNYDSVMLFLGTNNMTFYDNNYPGLSIESIKYKAIVDKIKEYDENIPIYIITPMATVNDYFRSRTAFNFMQQFYSTFKSYKNIEIIPIILTVDTVNDFGESNKIHPLESGYNKIAYAVYSVLCAN